MVEKVFVNSENIATFKCPVCATSWEKDLSQLTDSLKNNRIKINCPCGFSSPAILEKRRHPRKTTDLTGAFMHDRSKRRGIIYVKNISKSGVGIKLSAEQFIHAGDRLLLKFDLDDQEKTFLNKEAVVKHVEGNFLGLEFCEFRNDDRLESYLREK